MKTKESLKDPYLQELDFEWKSEAGTMPSSEPVFCQSGYFTKLKVHILLPIAKPVPFCKKPKGTLKKQQNHHISSTGISFITRCNSSCCEQSPTVAQSVKGNFRAS